MTRTVVLLVALSLLAGCTSPELRGVFSVGFRENAPSSHDVVPYPVEAVWDALPLAYDDLGLPGGRTFRGSEREFMTPQLRVQGQLYGRRNAEFIDCDGRGGLGASLEDSGEVFLAMLTQLEETSPTSTTIRTQVDVYASRRNESGHRIVCASRGVLEEAIVQALVVRLRGGDAAGNPRPACDE